MLVYAFNFTQMYIAQLKRETPFIIVTCQRFPLEKEFNDEKNTLLSVVA